MGACDRCELVVEPACEPEQVVALVFQRNTYWADVTRIDRFAPTKLCDNEIEHLITNVQVWAGQEQDVVGESGGKRSDIAGQRLRSRFGLPGERDPFGKVQNPGMLSRFSLAVF